MKYLTLFLLAGIFFGSCTDLPSYNEVVIIVGRKTTNDKVCYFTTNKVEDDLFGQKMGFMDYCEKYRVGDTIIISRK